MPLLPPESADRKTDLVGAASSTRAPRLSLFQPLPAWAGKTAVVCGASSGLGLAIAEQLIQQRITKLILLARNAQRLAEASQHLQNLASMASHAKDSGQSQPTPALTPVPADLMNPDSLSQAVQQISSTCSSVDLLVQAVGRSDRGTIQNLTRERLIEQVDANVITSLHAIQHFRPLLRSARGVLVLIGSLSSLFAPRYLGGYSISKHGLAALAQQARLELADDGVHVMLCCPGPIARSDSGLRYRRRAGEENLPAEALLPGGGARIRGLDAGQLACEILKAASCRTKIMIRPRKAWWLRLISHLLPDLGESILRRSSR